MAQPAKTTPTYDSAGTASPSALVAKAKELTPFFTAQAAANEAKGSLTDETLAALRKSGLLGMWLPRCFGGSEVGPVEGLEIIEAVSYADGSTGWTLMAIEVGTGSAAAYLDPAGAQKVFGKAHPLIAGQGAALGRADVEDKGYRLTGRWRYGSGLMHSEYFHTGAIVHENGTPRMMPGTKIPEARIFIVPRREGELLGNWDVLGLRATASVDYAITNVFVPAEMTHLQQIRKSTQGGNLYRLGIGGMGSICHAGFALGVSRRALDELAAMARGEGGKSASLPQLGGSESFHEQFGEAEARLRACRALVLEAQRDIETTLMRGEDMSVRQITMARLALNYVTSTAAEIVTFAYKYGGGTSLRSGVLQRCFRDMFAGTQHSTTTPDILRECGKELLGIAKGKIWGSRGLIDPT